MQGFQQLCGKQVFRVTWRDEDGKHLTHMSKNHVLIAQRKVSRTILGKGVVSDHVVSTGMDACRIRETCFPVEGTCAFSSV